MSGDDRPVVGFGGQAGDVETGDIAGGNIYKGVSLEHVTALVHELLGDTRQFRELDLRARERRQDEQDIFNSALKAQIGQLQSQQRATNIILIVFGALLIIAFVVAIGLLVDRIAVVLGLLLAAGVAARMGIGR